MCSILCPSEHLPTNVTVSHGVGLTDKKAISCLIVDYFKCHNFLFDLILKEAYCPKNMVTDVLNKDKGIFKFA